MKLRGQRIELGEIEHALRAQPGVDELVVLVHADALVAYVNPASIVINSDVAGCNGFTEARPLGRVACLAGAATALPAYMLPSVVVGVKEWSRTSSAKIDRKRLPAPALAGATAAQVVVPRTSEERVVRDAFAATLGLAAEAVSVEASFFELGGNSLTAVMLARRLSEALGRGMSMADVLQRPTVAGIAGGGEAASQLPPLLPISGGVQTGVPYARAYLDTCDMRSAGAAGGLRDQCKTTSFPQPLVRLDFPFVAVSTIISQPLRSVITYNSSNKT